MSSMDINKAAGAVVLVALVLMVIGIIGNALVHPRDSGTVVAVAPPEPTLAKEETTEAPVPFGTLLVQADPKHGAKIFNKCKSCHSAEKGAKHKIGPNLWDVVNSRQASNEGFSYSSAMQEKGEKWTYEHLNAFLTKPRDYVPGTKMTFAGLRKAKDRADVIAYLRTLSDSPAPLPSAAAAH